ncbi:MAG: hypothetical protein JWP74_1424 [Marmoricola sp.]|nr:hypothetical protein [Marmoricola sp.]
MHFYDASCGSVHRLEVCRLGDLAAAGEATVARYLTAWQRARECPTSGLSPVAWLLTLPTEQGRPQVVEKEKQVHDVNEGAARE